MKSSENTEQILAAYINAAKSFKVPVRDLRNDYLGTDYASLKSCLNSVIGPLLDNDCILQQGSDVRDIMEIAENSAINGRMVRKQVEVWTRLWHISGQWLQSSVTLEPPIGKDGRVGVQQMGSLLSYGRRYSLKPLLALADTDGLEDDGHMAQGGTNGDAETDGPITTEQVDKLDALLMAADADIGKFAKFMGVDQINDIKQSDFRRAVAALKQKIKRITEESEGKTDYGYGAIKEGSNDG